MTALDDRTTEPDAAGLVLGVGVAQGCTPEALRDLARLVLERAERSGRAAPVRLVATLDRKADHRAVQALAALLDVAIEAIGPARLDAERNRVGAVSQTVERLSGLSSVAEAAALAAAGPGGTLVVEKTKAAHATCAAALYFSHRPEEGEDRSL